MSGKDGSEKKMARTPMLPSLPVGGESCREPLPTTSPAFGLHHCVTVISGYAPGYYFWNTDGTPGDPSFSPYYNRVTVDQLLMDDAGVHFCVICVKDLL